MKHGRNCAHRLSRRGIFVPTHCNLYVILGIGCEYNLEWVVFKGGVFASYRCLFYTLRNGLL